MRKLILISLSVVLLAFAALSSGQELGDPSDSLAGEGTQLQSGGGEGTQFPEGVDNCSGDRYHHSHDYPLQNCARTVNPHYATNMGGGAPCQDRAKRCDSCYTCCSKQHQEAVSCHCYGSSHCEALQNDVERTCRHACFGHYTDACTAMP